MKKYRQNKCKMQGIMQKELLKNTDAGISIQYNETR